MWKRNLAAATDADLAGAFDREACKGDENVACDWISHGLE